LAYHKPFKVDLPKKRKYQNRLNPDNSGDLFWPKTKECTGAGVINGVQKWAQLHSWAPHHGVPG